MDFSSWRKNSANTEIAISLQDWVLQDASSDLAALKPGDTIRFQEAAASGRFYLYQIRTSTNQGSYYEFEVEVVDEGEQIRNNQLCNADATVRGVVADSPLVEDVGYYDTDDTAFNGAATVRGYRRNDLEDPIVETTDAHGVDIQGVKLTKSPDWDIVAYSGGSGGGITVGGIQTIKQNNTVWVDTAEGDDTLDANRGNVDRPFKTIRAACDYVETQGPTDGNDWVVQVNPGVYVELPIVCPRNTQIRGTSDFKTNIFPAVDGQPLITMNIFSNLSNLNLDGRIGVFGSDLQENAIFIPFSVGNTFEKLLVNNFQKGVTVQTGSGIGNIDSNWVSISMGQLGPVSTPITLLNNTSINMTNYFAEAESTLGFDLRSGTKLTLNGGFIANASLVAQIADGATLQLYTYDLINIGKMANIDGNAVLKHVGGTLSGTGADNLIDVTGFTPDISIDAVNASGFARILNVINGGASIFISDCTFTTAGDNSTGIQLRGFTNTQVKDCTFFSTSLTGTKAIDAGVANTDSPFLDTYNCLFFNYAISITQQSGQINSRDCTFEIFGPPDVNQIGIDLGGNAGAFIQDNLFVNIGTGCLTSEQSVVNMDGVRFVFAIQDFEQQGSSQIRLNNCVFNEDNIKAEFWSNIRGTYLSTKAEDEALSVPDKLKVGIPEVGEISSFGQGANFTRGLLVYTFNSETDTFEDVTDEARDTGGGAVTFPSTQPNSAIYISHELTDEAGDSFPFSGVWMNITTFGDVGDGEIISEVWNGSSWQEIEDMLTQAVAPYNQIPRGDGINIPEGRYNFRFDDRIETIWEESDPVGRGEDSYWYRFRIKGNWFNLAWGFRAKFTAQPTAISGNHVNIPLMLDLSTLDQSFWDNVKADGSDIRVTDGTGTNELPVEVSTIDTGTQTGKIWFSSDVLSAAVETEYYIYYGNAAAVFPLPSADNGSTRVWQEYIAVYHFDDTASNGATVSDEAGLTKVINGTVEGASIASQSDGVLDNYYDYDSIDTDSVVLPSEPEIVSPGAPITMQCLFRDPGGNDKRRLVSVASAATGDNDEDNFGLYIQNNQVYGSFTSGNVIISGVTVNNDQWRSCHLTTDTNIGGLYVDGALVGTTTNIGGLTPSPFPPRIGNRGSLAGSFSFGGGIDEVRFFNGIMFPDRVTTETTNIFFQNLFFVVDPSETREEVQTGEGGDPIVSSPEIDQIKIHPLGFTEVGEDGFVQYFGSARPIVPLQIQLATFTNLPVTGSPPQTGSELWLTSSAGQAGSFYFGQGIRTGMTAVKALRTEVDTSSPLRIGLYFSGLSVNAGDVLWRASLSFSDGDSTLFPTFDSAPNSIPKQTEALALSEVEDSRLGKIEFQVIEVAIPDIDLQQTYDARSDLAWLTIERVGDSGLDSYDNTVKVLAIQVLGTMWRSGSHTGILGDGPPPGLPGGTSELRSSEQKFMKLVEKNEKQKRTKGA